MRSSWPLGVTTQEDMRRYAKTLFGDCEIENLLTGMPFDGNPGCFLIRVKGACNEGNWERWPDLIDEAMKDTVELYGTSDVIQVKSAGVRLYDTLQVTPFSCSCQERREGNYRVHISDLSCTATRTMGRMLMAKFKPTKKKWEASQPSYQDKEFNLVVNKYLRNYGIDPPSGHLKDL